MFWPFKRKPSYPKEIPLPKATHAKIRSLVKGFNMSKDLMRMFHADISRTVDEALGLSVSTAWTLDPNKMTIRLKEQPPKEVIEDVSPKEEPQSLTLWYPLK